MWPGYSVLVSVGCKHGVLLACMVMLGGASCCLRLSWVSSQPNMAFAELLFSKMSFYVAALG